MYIGSTGVRGLHHLVYEVVDNSVDEALAGLLHARSTVTIHPDNSVTVVDDGRGIPVAMHGEGGPAGRRGRADRPARRRQVRRRRRLQGLRRPARRRRVGRQRALRASSTSRSAATATSGRRTTSAARRRARSSKGEPTKETGTTITFLPDAEIFETLDFDFTTLEQRLRETAFLTRGLQITLIDERGEGHTAEFQYEGGIEDFVALPEREQGADPQKVVYFEGESEEGAVEVAMQWNSSYQESVFSFANNINTHEGGSHLSGFRSALTRTLNKYAREKGAAQGEGRQPLRRGRARGPDRGHLGQARATRSSRARPRPSSATPGMAGLRRVDRQHAARRVPRGEPAGGARGDHARRSRPRRPARPRARRAT